MTLPSPLHILFLDLTREQTRRVPLDAVERTRNPGGRALAGACLARLGHRGTWDDPQAPIGLFPGRLAGVDLPGTGRLTTSWLSPLTGIWTDAGFGGRLGAALARAGLAGVVITGRARTPRGLCIRDDAVSLVDASALVGLSTDAVFAALGAFDGALVTGPAAWNGSRLAGAVVDRWYGPSRGGLGLALARKQCLFLAATGHTAIPVVDAVGLEQARTAIVRLVGASPALGPGGLGRHGSAALVDLTHGRHMMPTRNFRATFFPQAGQVNAPRLEAGTMTRGVACPGCPVACHRLLPGGRLFPEVDGLSHVTALLGLADGDLAVQAQVDCLRLGLDPISAAATLACRAEIDDREPTPADVLQSIAAMASGEGFGRVLGQGVAALAVQCGRPETAMVVKGMALPAFDPRGAYGLALGLAVSAVGPDAWRAGCLAHEMLRKPVATDRFRFEGKARAVFLGENTTAALESLGVCPWLSLATSLEEWAQALTAVTGEDVSPGALARIGERTVFGERVRLSRCKVPATADDLPARFFTDPGSGGAGFAVPPLPREAFLKARAGYYRLRGLRPDAMPDPARARALELSWMD